MLKSRDLSSRGLLMTNVKRLSLSVPLEVSVDLNFVHRRLNISKSALVTSLLKDGLRDFRMLLEALPPVPDDTDMIRFRGASAKLISARMDALRLDLDDSKGKS